MFLAARAARAVGEAEDPSPLLFGPSAHDPVWTRLLVANWGLHLDVDPGRYCNSWYLCQSYWLGEKQTRPDNGFPAA